MSNEQVRGAVLRAAYHAQEDGRMPTQSATIIRDLELEGKDANWIRIANAIDYLTDHGYIDSKKISALNRDFDVHMVTRVTAHGVDNVEQRVQETGVVQNFQIIGTNYGQAVQHGNASITYPPFPAETLRSLLAGNAEGLQAVTDIESELNSGQPRLGKLMNGIDVLKSIGSVGEAVTLVSSWVTNPAVHAFLASHIK